MREDWVGAPTFKNMVGSGGARLSATRINQK